MAKSKFYGYTLRNTGILGGEQWTLNEIPYSSTAILTATITASIVAGSTIPVSSKIIDNIGCCIDEDGTFRLPAGLYKIDYTITPSTETAGPVEIDLKAGMTKVSFVTGHTVANTAISEDPSVCLSGTGITRLCAESNLVYLHNGSTVAIEPVLNGSYSVIVTIQSLV